MDILCRIIILMEIFINISAMVIKPFGILKFYQLCHEEIRVDY